MRWARSVPLTLALFTLAGLASPLSPATGADETPSRATPSATIAPEAGRASPGWDRAVIRQAQRALKRKSYTPGPADGVVGPRTQAALKRYQEAERLEPTGELNRETLVRLGVRDPTPEHVREVQQALSEIGFDPGPADGRFGARTKAALRRYASPPTPRGQGPAYDTIERFMRETGQLQSP
jgi:peptidoglycan hydrolase-like protein with peptidoglycan-binding domain